MALPFYRVEKHGKVSWILGTLHLPLGVEELPPYVRKCLDGARLVATETGTTENHFALRKFVQENLKPASSSFLNILDGMEKSRLRSLAKEQGVDLSNLADANDFTVLDNLEDIFNGSFAIRVWSRLLEFPGADADLEAKLKKAGLTVAKLPDAPKTDVQISERASRAGKPVIALDTPSDSLRLMSTSVDRQDLKRWIKSNFVRIQSVGSLKREEVLDIATKLIANFNENRIRMLLTWRPDQKVPIAMPPESTSVPASRMPVSGPIFMASKRHELWIPKLVDEFERGSAFVAVGLAHLENNPLLENSPTLLQLLTQLGYSVTFVENCEGLLK